MIIQANAARRWPLADQSVQCIVTSPPYWGPRDYGVEGQLGSEATLQAYVAAMVGVFSEAWRVLRDDGTLWLNLGDCYRDKNLQGIPWRVVFGLQDSRWLLRKDIVWHKTNATPEAVTDRPTTAHEYLFLLSKGAKYYYDKVAIMEPVSGNAHGRGAGVNPKAKVVSKTSRVNVSRVGRPPQARQNESFSAAVRGLVDVRNKRSVWAVPSCGALDESGVSHFAAFPPALIEPCILAGAPLGGVVLDPFAGTGTTIYTAQRLGRVGVGLELNAAYARLAARNCALPVMRQGVLV